jgi:hypothetical protein
MRRYRWSLELKTNPMVGSEELGKNAVEQLDLSGRTNERIVHITTRIEIVLDALEQEWMLANLTELHELVTETLDATRFPGTRC